MENINETEEKIRFSCKILMNLDFKLRNLICELLIEREELYGDAIDYVQIFEVKRGKLIHSQREPEKIEEYELDFPVAESKVYAVSENYEWKLIYAEEYDETSQEKKFELKIHMPVRIMVTEYVQVSAKTKEEAIEKSKRYLQKGYSEGIRSSGRISDWNSSYKIFNSQGDFKGIISESESYNPDLALYSNFDEYTF